MYRTQQRWLQRDVKVSLFFPLRKQQLWHIFFSFKLFLCSCCTRRIILFPFHVRWSVAVGLAKREQGSFFPILLLASLELYSIIFIYLKKKKRGRPTPSLGCGGGGRSRVVAVWNVQKASVQDGRTDGRGVTGPSSRASSVCCLHVISSTRSAPAMRCWWKEAADAVNALPTRCTRECRCC